MDKKLLISGIACTLVGLYNLGLAIWQVLSGISALSFGVLFFVSGSLLTLGIVFFCLIVANAAKAKGDKQDWAGGFRQK